MYAIDFEYDGQNLSDYGFIVCDFEAPSGIDIVNSGSQITFNKVPKNRGIKHSLTSTQYQDCITATFDICKNPCKYENEMEITDDEYRDILRWLNRKQFHRFRAVDSDIKGDICYFNASFNIEKIEIAKTLYGLRLSMETDSPFGYGEKEVYELDFSETTQNNPTEKTITDVSDEIGIIHPDIEIRVLEAGDITLSNAFTGCRTTIKNCSVNEIINIYGESLIITSNATEHIYNDFNYDFFTICNSYDNRENRISATKKCKVIISYYPIIKGVF